MLYRTHHHPFLYTFNPFSQSSLSPHFLSSSSPRLQGMECVPGGGHGVSGGGQTLKSGAFTDELVVPGGGHGVSGDDFFVDELLDFSNGFEEELPQQLEEPEEKEQDKNITCSVSQKKLTAPENSDLSLKVDFGSLPESELSAPSEGLESLEWLSHFVEDSFSDYSLTVKIPAKPTEKRPEPKPMSQEQPCFTTPGQTKARTKRARTGVRVWPVLSPSHTDSSTSSSSSSSSSSTMSFSPPNPWAVQSQTGDSFIGKPVAKKPKKKPADPTFTVGGSVPAQPRRCSHCGVTKTPQWRAGPLGSKTLCNACGVRYKSGRLLPEYRPACSPTFSSEMHSNNHRKVLEMRRKKELEMETAGPPPSVHSF